MSDPVVIILLALLLGIVFGVLFSRLISKAAIEKAYERGKKELEAEKAELSLHLTDQLSKMREGLLQTLDAYSGAVRAVETKLPLPVDHLGSIGSPPPVQLKLELRDSDTESSPSEPTDSQESAEEIAEQTIAADREEEVSVESQQEPSAVEKSSADEGLEVEAKSIETESELAAAQGAAAISVNGNAGSSLK